MLWSYRAKSPSQWIRISKSILFLWELTNYIWSILSMQILDIYIYMSIIKITMPILRHKFKYFAYIVGLLLGLGADGVYPIMSKILRISSISFAMSWLTWLPAVDIEIDPTSISGGWIRHRVAAASFSSDNTSMYLLTPIRMITWYHDIWFDTIWHERYNERKIAKKTEMTVTKMNYLMRYRPNLKSTRPTHNLMKYKGCFRPITPGQASI